MEKTQRKKEKKKKKKKKGKEKGGMQDQRSRTNDLAKHLQ